MLLQSMVPALLRPARQDVFGIELGGFAGETIVRRTSTSTAERLQERPDKKKQIHRNGTHAFELVYVTPRAEAATAMTRLTTVSILG